MVAIGCDHGGYELKKEIIAHLTKNGVEFKDFGTYDGNSVDYPDIAKLVCKSILSGECENGILVCGTGIGISIAANKHKGIRAAVCSDEFSAKFTRLHNDANVLCLGGRVVGPGLACELVDIFLSTGFEGGRHALRVDKITAIENEN
ncbi:MAG: ribose 5-phosphate isomerase B [Ruminococcaceae bacterium]|nr:ribose 5-phosphate isomerase B [Oscillospiraceae bacterium]